MCRGCKPIVRHPRRSDRIRFCRILLSHFYIHLRRRESRIFVPIFVQTFLRPRLGSEPLPSFLVCNSQWSGSGSCKAELLGEGVAPRPLLWLASARVRRTQFWRRRFLGTCFHRLPNFFADEIFGYLLPPTTQFWRRRFFGRLLPPPTQFWKEKNFGVRCQ